MVIKITLVSGSLISTCMPKPGVAGRKEPVCLSHSCVLYFPTGEKDITIPMALQEDLITKQYTHQNDFSYLQSSQATKLPS